MTRAVHNTLEFPSVLLPPTAPAIVLDALGVLFGPDRFALTALLATRLPFPFVAGVDIGFPFSLVLDASESSGCCGRGPLRILEAVGKWSWELEIWGLDC